MMKNNPITDILVEQLNGKKWYFSKTIWTNIIAALAFLIQSRYGFVIPLEAQALALTGLNLLLRAITRVEIKW